MKHRSAFILTAAVLFAGAAAAFAVDSKDKPKTVTVTLKDGKVLQDAYILDRKPNGIMLAYREGCMFIPYSDMPYEYQRMFDYNLVKSARYENKQAEQKRRLEKEEKERKDREKQRKSEEEKRYKDKRIESQKQKVRKLEIELDEAQKRLQTTEQTLSQDREILGMSDIDSNHASIESPWGYGGRIRNGDHNGAVRNKLLKEVDALSRKRGNQAQDVIDLQLKLEAAQRTLDELIEKQ